MVGTVVYVLLLSADFVRQVVVKFIRKSKVLTDCWTDDDELARVPMEISLLTKLNHPNIVTVMPTLTAVCCILVVKME